jgi:hypothetical protein
MAGGAAVGPNGVVLGVEVRWCPGCHADRTVEMVRLASDPEPVAVCTECGVGLESWLTAETIELVGLAEQIEQIEHRRAGGKGQGAA